MQEGKKAFLPCVHTAGGNREVSERRDRFPDASLFQASPERLVSFPREKKIQGSVSRYNVKWSRFYVIIST